MTNDANRWAPRPHLFSFTPPRVSETGVDKKTRRANLRLSYEQTDTPSKIFSKKIGIFSDKTASGNDRWRLGVL